MHVDGALAAVLNGRSREADDDQSQIRLFEPARNIALQYPTLAIGFPDMRGRRSGGLAFAGDDEDETKASVLATQQKSSESRMGFVLAHTVQIDARLDVEPAATNFSRAVAVEKGEVGRRGTR